MSNQIYPAQSPIPTCSGCPPPIFVLPNSVIYNSQISWPIEPVTVEHQGYFDGNNNILTLAICPFEYFPTTGQLDLFTNIEINVTLVSGYNRGIKNIHRLQKNQSLYDEVLLNMIENTQDIDLYKTDPTFIGSIKSRGPLPSFEYVIITPAAYYNSFDEFIDWKKKKGIDIGIVAKEDILSNYSGDMIFPGYEIYDDAGKIRQYLYESYQEGTVWALLVGDASVLPIRYGCSTNDPTSEANIIPTDLYFADFNGNWNVDGDDFFGEPGWGSNGDDPDYFPEIYIGRLLCSSAQDVSNWAHKLLIYEKNPGNGDLAYLTDSFMFQADQLQEQDQAPKVAALLPTFNHEIWGEQPSYYSVNPIFPKGADIIAEMNSTNYGMMSWFGHGGTGGQNSGVSCLTTGVNGSPYWKMDAEDEYEFHDVVPEDNDGLDNLTNFNYPFFIYAISCDITPFDITKGLNNNGARNCGESFTVNNLAGGVAFLGNTRYGYVGSSFYLFKKFADLLTQSTINPTYYPSCSHIGVVESVSKNNSSSNYLRYSHNLIGEPEMQIWTLTPQYLTADVNPDIAISDIINYFEVTVHNLAESKQATVCLYKENEVFASQIVQGDANNQAVAIFDDILPTSTGEISVTIVSHNYIPLEATIPVEENCTITVNTDEIWDTDLLVSCDIVVETGVNLTINCKVSLFPGRKVIVKQSAKITIDGGTITNATDQPWQGIQVWGNSTASQLALPGQPNPQGKLVLKNEATIENAVNAVTLWKPGDWNTNGGIVVANDAHFINNRRSAEFRSFQNTHPVSGLPMGNISHFTNCHFEVNDDYSIADDPFNCHISMFNVDGIQLTGNSFLNQMTEGGNSGAGIISIDANYRVVAGCNSFVAPCPPADSITNHFEGFAYGIDASSTTSKTIYVRQAEFVNNGYGIRLNALNNATIIQNNFSVGTYGKGDWMCGTDFGIGIELAGCNYYAVEENTFTPVSPLSTIPFMGIRVLNNDEENVERNEIYFNTFDQMNRANQADGINYTLGDPHLGLNYRCNQNTNNYFDFVTTGQGIAGYQSSLGYAADNTFTSIFQQPGDPRHFFNDATNHVTYIYRPNMPNTQPLYVYNVTTTPFGSVPPGPCTSNYGGGNEEVDPDGLTAAQKQYFEQELTDSHTAYTGVKNLYASLLDGGNTDAVQSEIAMAWPEDMWELRAELLGLSPLLSKDVLVSASDRTDVLPESIIFEVLSANPDELKKKELMEHLETKDNPLPEYMIEILESLTDNVTYKTILQSQMAHYGRVEGRATGILLRDMLNDSTATPENIRTFMAERQSLPMDMQRVDSYLESGETAQALTLAASLPQQYGLEGEALAEHGRFVQLKQLQTGLHNQGRNIFQLTPTEKEQLEELIEQSSGTAGRQARSILAFVYEEEFCDCPADINPELKASTFVQPPLNKLDEPKITVHPNPAKTWVSFNYSIPGGSSNATLEIRDAGGKLVYQTTLENKQGQYVWDTRNIASGLYHYTLKTTHGIKTGKVTIIN